MRQDDRYRHFQDYHQREGINQVRDSGPVRDPGPPGGVDAKSRLAVQFFDATNHLAGVKFKTLLQEQEEERAVKATEILNQYRSDLARFQDEYTRKKQGWAAYNAGAEFKDYARKSGDKVLDGLMPDPAKKVK